MKPGKDKGIKLVPQLKPLIITPNGGLPEVNNIPTQSTEFVGNKYHNILRITADGQYFLCGINISHNPQMHIGWELFNQLSVSMHHSTANNQKEGFAHSAIKQLSLALKPQFDQLWQTDPRLIIYDHVQGARFNLNLDWDAANHLVVMSERYLKQSSLAPNQRILCAFFCGAMIACFGQAVYPARIAAFEQLAHFASDEAGIGLIPQVTSIRKEPQRDTYSKSDRQGLLISAFSYLSQAITLSHQYDDPQASMRLLQQHINLCLAIPDDLFSMLQETIMEQLWWWPQALLHLYLNQIDVLVLIETDDLSRAALNALRMLVREQLTPSWRADSLNEIGNLSPDTDSESEMSILSVKPQPAVAKNKRNYFYIACGVLTLLSAIMIGVGVAVPLGGPLVVIGAATAILTFFSATLRYLHKANNSAIGDRASSIAETPKSNQAYFTPVDNNGISPLLSARSTASASSDLLDPGLTSTASTCPYNYREPLLARIFSALKISKIASGKNSIQYKDIPSPRSCTSKVQDLSPQTTPVRAYGFASESTVVTQEQLCANSNHSFWYSKAKVSPPQPISKPQRDGRLAMQQNCMSKTF